MVVLCECPHGRGCAFAKVKRRGRGGVLYGVAQRALRPAGGAGKQTLTDGTDYENIGLPCGDMPMPLIPAQPQDRFAPQPGGVYLNGTQALVRLLLMQKWRDAAAGLRTAGFVSGYRGSPLGGLDRELWRAQQTLTRNDIHFWPGINEDLAATAVWGTQMVGLQGDAEFDGVFGLWYGKGAGLDRCGDVMRHANASGAHPRGGVLAVVGDDHAQKSSTQPYFSEPTFADLLMPVLYPSNIAEMIEYGILGWALSRFSGVWAGLKSLAELLDCSVSLDEQALHTKVTIPTQGRPPPGSVHLRWPDPWSEGEIRWIEHRLPAVHAFARANALDRVTLAAVGQPNLGIVTTGKSYRDLLQALHDLGLDLQAAAALGVSIYKVGMPWPLEPAGVRDFAAGVPEILIIEEKRPIIEDQVRVALSGLPHAPVISGKRDAQGHWQFPWVGELSPDRIAWVLARKLSLDQRVPGAARRIAELDREAQILEADRPVIARPAFFCSGCPHNTSTRVPQGSRAIAGVGCHYMAVDMDRSTSTFSQMGGEGATWIGQAPFTRTRHVFVNLGEGTYFHSGSLAVRACIAAGVNMTYKLLFNDAVAMTGGQPVDGQLTVPQLAWQLHAEGIRGIRIVAEDPQKYRRAGELPPGTTVEARSRLDQVQRELRDTPGVTALIYDQTCAAEKRRRRKRGRMEDPERWVQINSAVCEGCGDCSKASNCLSVVPIDTEHGRKRAIDQSSCNKDLSCVDGFCPSFVTVTGGRPKRPAAAQVDSSSIPEPPLPALNDVYNVFITGIGGTGVVTVGAVLGLAAHLEGKGCSILDQLGMAQKGGAVVSHVRIARSSEEILSARVPTARADVVLGFDLPVTIQDTAFRTIQPGKTRVILNTHETITGAFMRDPDMTQPTREMVSAIREVAGEANTDTFDATLLATGLVGHSIGTNLLVLGYAFQKGLIPLSRDSLLRAIRLNGVAVDSSVNTFEWGRWLASHPQSPAAATVAEPPLEDLIERRGELLRHYQDSSYERQYADFIERVRAEEQQRTPGQTQLVRAVALSLFKLMAYKDEYEVARLYTDGTFARQIQANFEGNVKLVYHLAPPLLARRDPHTGHLRKRAFGQWLRWMFRALVPLRRLRGTWLDPFGYTAERQMERRLIGEYRSVIERVLLHLTPQNHARVVALARLPLDMRGFGHVKEANVRRALAEQARLLTDICKAEQPMTQSESANQGV
jgi:indolepyruvate ferredoxin oxidoreductase